MNVLAVAATSLDKKPIVREVCWHQLLRHFVSDEDNPVDKQAAFEEHKFVVQSHKHPLMTQRYTDYIRRQISGASADFDALMYGYSTTLIRTCFQIARERNSNEYAYLSDYLILGLQSVGIEKDFNDILFGLDAQPSHPAP